MKRIFLVVLSTLLLATMATTIVKAEDKELTLCWAAWDPANALRELSTVRGSDCGLED